jgi:phosphatidylserine/phosphatidylglycerophosphate/cardiolipin synthase-like enzyme
MSGWAQGDFAVHPLAFATPLIDGRAAMLAMCLSFLEARTSIWIGGWSIYARLRLVRGQDQRAGEDGASEQNVLLDRLRAAGLDSDAIALWRADGLALVDVLGLAVRRGVDVRVLLWDPLDPWNLGHLGNDPVIQAAILTDQGIQCRLDKNCRSPLHIAQGLHQKCAVVDSEVAFVGGIDVTVDYGGDFDRWDVSDHPFESDLRATDRGDSPHPWHDAHVMLTGAAVLDVERNLRERWDASAGRVQQRIQPLRTQVEGIQGAIASGDRPQAWAPGADEPAPPTTSVEKEETKAAEQAESAGQPGSIQIVRTIPALTYRFAPGGIYGIAQTYQQAINQAERFIYLESQYLWVEGLRLFNITRLGWQSRKMRALVEDLALAAERGVHIALVLPDHPNVGRAVTDETIQWLRDHAPHAVAEHRLHFYTLATSSPDAREHAMRYRPVYVHAKVAVIDDRWATVGSANLNSRGMSHDAEMNVVIAQQAFASGLRRILWAEHTGVPLPADFSWPTGAAEPSPGAATTSTASGTPLALRALTLTRSMPGPREGSPGPAGAEATKAANTALAASLADPARGLRALAQLADENLRRLRQGEALSGYLLPYLRASEGPAYGLRVDRRRGLLDPLREVREGVAVPHYNRYI